MWNQWKQKDSQRDKKLTPLQWLFTQNEIKLQTTLGNFFFVRSKEINTASSYHQQQHSLSKDMCYKDPVFSTWKKTPCYLIVMKHELRITILKNRTNFFAPYSFPLQILPTTVFVFLEFTRLNQLKREENVHTHIDPLNT